MHVLNIFIEFEMVNIFTHNAIELNQVFGIYRLY